MVIPPVILILGPTASGKSALAFSLAELFDGQVEIVSADSMQIYRGMDIGTAKPSHAEQARVPHHLIDVANPHEEGFTVERWLESAHAAIENIQRSGKSAVVVGGTNLYVQALLAGLFEGPSADESLRSTLRELSLAELRTRLIAIDPPSAERIHPNDQRRMIRAIEVTTLTGIALSAHQTQWNARGPSLPVGWQCLGLLPDPKSNATSINRRVKTMMENGFLDEVRRLVEIAPLGRQAGEAVGYRELAQHIAGTMPLEDAFEAIKIRTRKLARQQRTWLRRFRHIERSAWSTDACDGEKSKEFFHEVLGLENDGFKGNK